MGDAIMWYLLLAAAVSTWVFVDARARKGNAAGWTLATFFLMVVALPYYFAKRSLRAGEVREGGTAWNFLRAFAILWTVTVAIAAAALIMAGPSLGTMLGLSMIGPLWFFPMIGAVVLGLLLKKNTIIEHGPTDSLLPSSGSSTTEGEGTGFFGPKSE